MNENAKKLVTALRSGEFEQTTGVLRSETGYCCLGVACELYRRETGGEWVREESDEGDWVFLGQGAYLPPAVRDWLGFSSALGGYDPRSLADDNDIGDSFDAIATTIEREPKGLFA